MKKGGEMNSGDFGRFVFIEKYKNGKLTCRVYDLYGTIIRMCQDHFELRDNDSTHTYKIEYSDLKLCKIMEPVPELRNYIKKLMA